MNSVFFTAGNRSPFAVLPFPEYCRIGDTFSMIVFHLDIEEIEYAYRLDGPYDPGQRTPFRPLQVYFGPLRQGRHRAERVGTETA